MSFLQSRPWRIFLPAVVWCGAVIGAALLYREGVGTGEAVGVAESKEYRVASSELGRVAAVEVREGQRVARGQVVARFETELSEREISVADARLRQVSSEIRAADVSLDVNTLDSERSFQTEIDATRVELQTAQSEFSRDKAERAKVLEELETQRSLVKRGLTKADRGQELELRLATLDESVKAWPARIQTIETRLRSATERLQAWQRTHTGASEGEARRLQLQPLHDKVREQQELIRMLKTRLQTAILRASSDASVARIHARPGDVLKPGDPVLTLVEVQPRQVIAYMEERRDNVLRPGAKVIARRRGPSREQFEGRIAAVSATVSQLPARFWTNPALPSWGREFFVELPQEANLDPGEAIDVTLLSTPIADPSRIVSESRRPRASND